MPARNHGPAHRPRLARDIAAQISADSTAISLPYGPRLARDIPPVTPRPCPEIVANPRVIVSILRFRLARDIATARSHDSSTFSWNSAVMRAEAGA